MPGRDDHAVFGLQFLQTDTEGQAIPAFLGVIDLCKVQVARPIVNLDGLDAGESSHSSSGQASIHRVAGRRSSFSHSGDSNQSQFSHIGALPTFADLEMRRRPSWGTNSNHSSSRGTPASPQSTPLSPDMSMRRRPSAESNHSSAKQSGAGSSNQSSRQSAQATVSQEFVGRPSLRSNPSAAPSARSAHDSIASSTGASEKAGVRPSTPLANWPAAVRNTYSTATASVALWGGAVEQQSDDRLLADRIIAKTKSVDRATLELLSFDGYEELLRGSPLSTVLRRRGQIFKNSEGTADTYDLSRQVEAIDAFISHNWSVPAHHKYAALALHFNLGLAATFAVLMMVIVATLEARGFFPQVSLSEDAYPEGVICRIICAPVFLLCLFLFRDVADCVHYGGPMVFLDKTCIHQVDEELQQQGIKRLGAFLGKSSAMLVVYTDEYLKKLWTVYEVASFLSLHPVARMRVMPTLVPFIFVFGILGAYLALAIGTVLELSTGFFYTFEVTLGCLAYLWTLAMRVWARERASMMTTLLEFRVEDCTCSKQGDKAVIHRNIALLMRERQVVRPGATEQEALQAFNAMIQEKLPNAFASAIASTGLSVRQVVLMGWCSWGGYVFDQASGLAHGMTWRYFLMIVLRRATFLFCGVPISCAAMALLAGCWPKLRGWREKVFALAGPLVAGLLPEALAQLSYAVLPHCLESDAWLGCMLAAYAAMYVVTWMFFRCFCSRTAFPRQRRGAQNPNPEPEGGGGEADAPAAVQASALEEL